jgi:hypothetical protein
MNRSTNLEWATAYGAELLGRRVFEASGRKSQPPTAPREVEHVQFPFRRWDGRIGPWKEHFGKGRGQVYPLLGEEPTPSCNEVELAKILRKVRDHAFWLSAFNTANMPKAWRAWVRSMNELPLWLEGLDSIIRDGIGSRRGGIPDVVAWNDDSPFGSALFLECKGPKEKFKESQEDWVGAAFMNGLMASQVAVSLRPF